jgi:bifunctional non-homologous end joining protein LigD
MTAPRPMKAVSGVLPTETEGWAYEIKWDGFRSLAVIDGETVTVYSSNGIDVTAKRSELAGLWRGLHGRQAVLDGELVALDDQGRPRFQLLGGDTPVTYVLFDLLELDGKDLTGLPFRDRRRLLDQAMEPGPHWLVGPWQEGDGAALLEASRARDLEGIMAKRLDSPYLPGRRSSAWRKIKNRYRQEMVIGGWTEGERARASTFGSLLVGHYEDDVLRYAGGVGTGFTDKVLRAVSAELAARAVPACPFDPPPTRVQLRHQRAHWVRPELVAEVEFAEWTDEGILRHPSFLGLRDDKDAREVVREQR